MEPLKIRLSTLTNVYKKTRPGEFVEYDDSILGVNGLNQASIVFTMEAKFANECCEFRQEVRGKHLDGHPVNGENPIQWKDDNYNREEDSRSYRNNPDGSVNFVDYDHAGTSTERTLDLVQQGQTTFSSWLSFKGYIVDVCKNNRRVGPLKNYGFSSSGRYGSIAVKAWGFDSTP